MAQPSRSLSRRFALQVSAVALVLLLVSGLSEMYFGYHEAREQMAVLQRLQAEAASTEIEQYLHVIEAGIRDASKLPWRSAGYGLDRKREEFYRLMLLYPAVLELRDVDDLGREQLFVSRTEADRLRALLPVEEARILRTDIRQPVRYGATFYRDGAEPLVNMAVAGAGPAPSTTIATLNLRFLADVVSGLKVGPSGQVYVVDSADRLIAHPRPSHVLRKLDMAQFATVRAARAAASAGNTRLLEAVDAAAIDGEAVITTAVRLKTTQWLVFVEQPRTEALQPAWATLQRTVNLVALGGVLALLAGWVFARRMAAPILALRRATARIASGDLKADIAVRTGDEIEMLANDFRHMATQLAQSYGSLESKVQERTVQLSEARDKLRDQAAELETLNRQLVDHLQEASLRKEEAERANGAKTRFLAAASHDLRQPMHSISLLVSVLCERLANEAERALALKVRLSVSAMENLFSSLLDISKLDAGVVQPQPQVVPVEQILRPMEHSFAAQASARGLTLRVARSGVHVRTDLVMLERLIGNLVSNAIRYTPRGGVLVGCRRRGERVAIQVVDTGVGIAPDQIEHIFEEFVRLPMAGHEPAEGLGLGLSIVKRSAELLGHGVTVRSRPGRGSIFEVLVPRAELPEPVDASDFVDAGGESVAGSFVLVVDDDATNREAMEALFRQWRCLTAAAGSADEALKRLDEHLRAPDLLITDFSLGSGADGFELLARVREATGDEVAAVVVTADVSGELLQRAQWAGARLLHKPTNGARLLREAVAALADRAARSASFDAR